MRQFLVFKESLLRKQNLRNDLTSVLHTSTLAFPFRKQKFKIDSIEYFG